MKPLQTLLDADPPAAAGDLTPLLAGLYGGGLTLGADLLYANFVTSLDGVAALLPRRGSGSRLSGRDAADRFLMALLRTLADAVVVGGGTLRADGGQSWSPALLSPDHAAAFAELRRPDPELVVVTASGELAPDDPALAGGGLVLTTDAGRARLLGRLPAACRLRSLGSEPPDGRRLLEAVRAEGHRRVLTEGGPGLLATLVAAGVLDELFLTLSPVLAGRRAGSARLGLLEGVELLPGDPRWARLLSLRAHGSHLFLRYALRRSAPA